MKIRPQRRSGLEVSLSKKFYQKSAYQTQQEIQKIQSQNDVKKEMIQRMTAELNNLQHFLNQEYLSKQLEKQHDLNKNLHKSSMNTIKTQKSPNKNTKHNHSMNIRLNQSAKSPQIKLSSPKGFTRSQSACKNSSKRNSNRTSFASVKRNSKYAEEVQSLKAKQQEGAKSYQDLKCAPQTNNNKKYGTIKCKKDENYVKYLECRLRQLAKEVKMHNETYLKIEKRGMGLSRRT